MGLGIELNAPPDGPVLRGDEVLRRIAPAFRRVGIDRVRADLWIDERCRLLEGLRCPNILIDGERQQKGRVAHVSLSDDESEDGWVRFYLYDDTSWIDLEFESEEHWRHAGRRSKKLAHLLGYVADELSPSDAEPSAAADRGGMSAFRDYSSRAPAAAELGRSASAAPTAAAAFGWLGGVAPTLAATHSGTRPLRPAKPRRRVPPKGARNEEVVSGRRRRSCGGVRPRAPGRTGAAPDRRSSAGCTTPVVISAAGELDRSAFAAPAAAAPRRRFGWLFPEAAVTSLRHAAPAAGEAPVARAAAKAREAQRWGWAVAGGRAASVWPGHPGRTGAAADGNS